MWRNGTIHFIPRAEGFDIETVDGIASDQVSYACHWKIFCFSVSLPRMRNHLATAAYPAPTFSTLPCGAHSSVLSRLKIRYRMQLGEGFTRCEPALLSGYCQAGLTRAHMNAWRRIVDSGEPAAWVFE